MLGIALGLVVVSSMGASCSPRAGNPFNLMGPPAPVVLTPTATAADVVAAVNANTDRVQTYQATSASISMPESIGLPLVQANLAAERPRRFRLRATTAITGPEIDLGSNDERFWIWARRNEPPAVYTARHDQWAGSPARGQVAIEPDWLIDAIGLVRLDPAATYIGPLPRGNGTFELRAQVNGPGGPQQRSYIIDAQSAYVREQHVYDANGSLTASVYADDFRHDPATNISLPERIRLNVPAAGLDLTINTGPIVTNVPISAGGQLWTMPQLGSPAVDLAAGAAATNAWDLAGVNSVYGQTPDVVTPFAEPPTPNWQSAAAPQATTPQAPPAGMAQAATPAAQVVTPAPRAGFVGIPAGGQVLPPTR